MPLPSQYSGNSWLHEHRAWCFFTFLFVGVAAIGVLFFADAEFGKEYQALQSAPEIKSKQETSLVRIQIEFGDEKRAFEGRAGNGLTLGAALSEISGISGLDLATSENGIAAIGTVKNDEKEWRVYKNDKPLPAPLSYTLRGGDRIMLRYE